MNILKFIVYFWTKYVQNLGTLLGSFFQQPWGKKEDTIGSDNPGVNANMKSGCMKIVHFETDYLPFW